MMDRFATVRERMVQEQLLYRGITDPGTLKAMAEVPRHVFVDDAMQAIAYGDHPLPIAADQTISQPYIVAAMTQALQLQGDEKVLEIGTGSGYQAAILSRLCAKVYTVERINTLLAGARRIFDQLHYYNILSRLDDGTMGWAEHAPYDAIIVTAGGPQIPDSLLGQLADPGRLVIPVGGHDVQELLLLTKEAGEIHTRRLESVRFVSLIGEQGWNG
ncbi:MAG: protein-L-isoaspartate(D-aspartate) O-methyltransferase [Proteobacteria bacterium]|nr:protein-L-isoaspartate(D-aspartate) O-methyltransferase [Pseudomonadota bacterium]MBU1059734.1 protein-L-isoaspartate(D-aspartate) O-methyltransferase [Pseudomonadota bacterium]